MEKHNIYVVFNLIYKRNKTQEGKCNNSTQSFINKWAVWEEILSSVVPLIEYE